MTDGPINQRQQHDTEPVSLPEVVRQARQEAGLSHRRLAERVGVHHSQIGRMESGEQTPTRETLHRLAQALELDAVDLFALAGYELSDRLPAFPAYLRAKYRMPDAAASQLTEYFGFLAEKYDIQEDDAAERPSDSAPRP
jgi:transcriptional regulator with XRE-family HTH domain